MPTSNSPNIVFFMCDQLRADALGFMGNPIVRTPNLDKLAKRGTVFENMFVQAPTCMPSRAAIMTGRYPRTCGMVGSGGLPLSPGDTNSALHKGGGPLLNPNETTLPELLQRGGYRTGLFGKLHLTPQQYTLTDLQTTHAITDAQPFIEAAGMGLMPDDQLKKNYGFQDVTSHEDALIGDYIDWLERRDPKLAGMLPKWPDHGMAEWEGAPRPFTGAVQDVAQTIVPPQLHPSMFIAESAAAHFTKHAPHQPCFTYVSFTDPHHPFDPPAELAEHYPAKDMVLPEYRNLGDVQLPKRLAGRTVDYSSVDDDQTRTIISYYYAMIEMADMAIGHVIDSVKQAGQMDNTIFAFVADHGEFLGDYGLFRKGSYLYDSLTHVPALIAGPGIAPGQRVSGLSQTIDLAPTLLGLSGLSPDPGMQGRNLATALEQGAVPACPWVFTEAKEAAHGPYMACWSLRTEHAKLNIYPHDHTGLLFDLDNDPDELCDLYNDPAQRPLRDNMTNLMFEAMQHQLDPLPLHLSGF